jgi:hypothetical protein
MKIAIFTPNFEAVYENSILLIHYCHQGFISLVALINL